MTAANSHGATPSERWAVVGGGLLGMVLALRLARAGRRVTVFEAADRLGGLAAAWRVGDVVWDRHYHVILQSDTHLTGLLAELGLDRDVRWTTTRTGFYTDGRLHSLSNTLEFLRFPPLGIIDKLRLGATIFYASKISRWRRLEHIAVIDWLRRWSGARTVDRIWLPLLRAKLGETYCETSAAFIWATIARMYAARRSGMKVERFGYVRGGYARILERFAVVLEREGVAIRLGSPARSVEPLPTGLRVVIDGGGQEIFDRAVLTMAAPLVPRICPALARGERERLAGVRYQGVICASVLLRQPLAGYYVTNITEPWVPFTAVIEMSALVDRAEFGGRALVYLPKYLASDDAAFGRPDHEIEAEWLAALARMYPGFSRDQVLAFKLSRVRYVMPVPTLGYSDRVPAMDTTIPGLTLVNSSQIVNGTLNVNETIALAERAMARVLAPADPWAGIIHHTDHTAYAVEAVRQPVAGSR